MSVDAGSVALALQLSSTSFEKSVSSVAKKAAGVLASALAVNGLKDFTQQCISLGSTLTAAESTFSTVFGNLESKAEQSLSSIAEQSGNTADALRSSFTQIASFAKTTGVDTAEALDLTTRATTAAADNRGLLRQEHRERHREPSILSEREALLPLDKNTDWMDTIADKVKQKVADTIDSVTVQSAQLDAGALLRKCTPVLAAMERSGEQTAAAAKAAEAERSASDTRRIETLLETILALLKDIDPVALDAESLRKYFIRVTNRNTQANSGRCELKV